MQIVRRLLEMCDLLLVLFVLLSQLLIPALLFLGIERVVAVIKLRPAVDDLDDALRDLVEKPAVVRYGEHRTLKVQQIVLQPLGRVHIEMVRRLVEQQNVRILQNEPGEIDARLFAAGEGVEKLLSHRRRDIQAVCHLAAAHLGVVSAERFKAGEQLVILGEQRAVVRYAHLLFEPAHPRLHRVEPLLGGREHVLHGIAVGVVRYLRHKPQPLAARNVDLALVLGQLADHEAEERRFPRAVAAENTDALAVLHLKGQPVENVFVDLKRFREVTNGNVNHSE